MEATEAARKRLSKLRERAGSDCIGFLFEGALGSCRSSSPILRPVPDPVPDSDEFRVGDVTLFARGPFAEVLREASFDYDNSFFGAGLTIRWPHRDGGCPNCR